MKWQEMRANWVNGNLTACRDALADMNKLEVIKIIVDAQYTIYRFINLEKGTRSGDLIDLIELLSSYIKTQEEPKFYNEEE